MKKELFKKGDRVFVRSWGWGIITHTKRKKSAILFEEEPYNKAVYIPNEVISFTEYFVENFSQERPINYNDYIGKWGKFWDKKKISKNEFLFFEWATKFFTQEKLNVGIKQKYVIEDFRNLTKLRCSRNYIYRLLMKYCEFKAYTLEQVIRKEITTEKRVVADWYFIIRTK